MASPFCGYGLVIVIPLEEAPKKKKAKTVVHLKQQINTTDGQGMGF